MPKRKQSTPKVKDRTPKECAARSNELMAALIKYATDGTNKDDRTNLSMERMRWLFRRQRLIDESKVTKSEITVNLDCGEILFSYYRSRVEGSLARFFDEIFATTPTEIQNYAVKYRFSIDEASQSLGFKYRNDMDKCLAHAMVLFEKQFPRLLQDAFDEFCYEAVAQTIRTLYGKLTSRIFDNPEVFFDQAQEFAAENQRRRINAPKPGRPKESGGFKTEEQFLGALVNIIQHLQWLGEDVNQANVATLINNDSDLPSCADASRLRALLRKFKIDWGGIVTQLTPMPERVKVSLDAIGPEYKEAVKSLLSEK